MIWWAFFLVLVLALWRFAVARPAPSSALRLPAPPLVIAHGDERGQGLYPGNTMLYLREMTALGADALEIDLNLTADGHLVLNHDPLLDRVSDGSGLIRQHTLESLRSLNMASRWTHDGSTFPYRDTTVPVATIDEVFAAFPDMPMILELKDRDPAAAVALAQSVRRVGKVSSLVVSSFHLGVIREFRRLCPDVATGATLPEALLFFLAQLLRLERWLRPAYQTMQLPTRYYGIPVFSTRLIRAAHRIGLHVSVWTVDATEDMEYYLRLGVDGIVTNRTDRLKSVRDRALPADSASTDTST
ncbi:glycerophosphodiester phosphodiesterase [Microbulbifer guangxiensis]|uniref:glycerophosphodiester phosphodiesterase n=1 Tax=Microbulbifer guangxiensis TaxID=2904249 RepID=UPI001F2F468D|nr:glycerophosphodiester phosphodiesterase [Microbulbifer guangxiensis]